MKSVLSLELRLLICACVVASLGASCERTRTEEAQKPTGIAALLPAENDLPGGWRVADTVRVFTGRELYEYINGGADIYHEYGFVEVAAQEYLTPGGVTVFLNLYKMSDPEAAFGIFSATRRPEYEVVAIGTAGARADYQQIFCHGAYYVETQAMDTDSLTAPAMGDLCRAMDSNLESEPDELPEALNLLNNKDLPPNSRVLVRGPLGLNTRKYLSDENLFSLSDSIPGVLASYQMFADRPEAQTILIVNYPDSVVAERVFSRLQEFYKEPAGDLLKGARLKTDETRLMFATDRDVNVIILKGKIIKAVFGLAPVSKNK